MKPSEIFEGENSGLRKAFDEAVARGETNADKLNIVHFGGESKEVIDAEDRWHEEQRNKTEKRLKDEWEDRVHGGHFVDKLYNFAPTSEVADDIADWWIEKLHQALAEERERVVMEIRKRMPSHDAVMEYLSSLDKP